MLYDNGIITAFLLVGYRKSGNHAELGADAKIVPVLSADDFHCSADLPGNRMTIKNRMGKSVFKCGRPMDTRHGMPDVIL